MRLLLILFITLLLTACSSTYMNQSIKGEMLPTMLGETLAKKRFKIPTQFTAPLSLLLVGYKQNSQFDIDRWLIALDVTKVTIPTYEIPAIQGMFPRMFKTQINNGMRKGIPKELWKGVITLYQDGEKIQQFTGNENANNTRVILINKDGKIIYFYDRGFSVDALNALKEAINSNSI